MKFLLRCCTCMVFALLFCAGLHSQVNWKQPMSDPNVSFYQVQQQFRREMRWKERAIERERRHEQEERQQGAKGGPVATEENEEEAEGYLQYKRWEYFMEPRVFPSGDLSLPSTTWARFQEYLDNTPDANYQYQRSQPGGNNQRIGGPNFVMASNWTFAGPTGAPVGSGAGRVNFIRIDPTNNNNLWCGAPAGGLWKSTNGGASWSTNTDFLTVIGASDVAIDPTNTQVMYLATGDGDAGDTYSIGVMKSTDGGATWNTTGLTWTVNQGRTISRLLINSTNTQIVMAFTSNGIYRTTNGGTSWTQVQTTSSFKDAEFQPGSVNTIYAGGTRFYKSTDGGATWTNITTGLPANTAIDRMSIAVTAANSAYVYVLCGSAANDGFYGFYRSTDNGTTFTTRSTTPNVLGWASAGNDTGGQGWYDLACDASPTNQDVVVVGGVNVWRSTNGGTNWTLNAHWTGSGAPYIHADVHCLHFLPGSGTTYFATSDGGVFKTTNSGGAWADLSNNLCIAQPYRIGLSGSNANLWITGHQDNGTNIKNGATYSGTMGGDGMDCFIDRTNNNVMYGEQYNGSLNRTTNGGGTWNGINTGLTGTAPWVTPWYQDPTTANTIYCGRTNLFKSTNQGTNWTQLTALPTTPSGTIVDFKVAPSNNQVIYVARSQGLFKTTNGGTSWTTVTGTLPVTSAFISRVDVKPNDPNTVYVTFSGYSTGNKVFKTSNGGTTWTNISTGLPNLPVNCVRFDPSGSATEAVYVGCDVGVYYMDNTFTGWQPYFTSLPNVPIFDLEVYATTGKLRAATYGRGVWEVDIYNPGTLPPVALFTANSFITCTGQPVNFTDQSSFAPTSWSWTFPSATPATSTAQNPTGVVWNTAGTYTVTLNCSNVNGNSSTTQVVTVLGAQSPPLVEGFQAAQFLPAGWTAKNINNDGIFWTQASTGYNSTQSALFDNYNNDVAGAQDEMWAPRLNCAAYTSLSMTFDVSYARYDATYSDSLQVLVSTNCGTTWTSVYLKGGTTLATVPDQTTAFTPTNAQWRNETVNLNTYAGQSSVLVIFRNRGHYGNNIYVDNINITGTAAAPPTAAFTASATSVCVGTAVNFTDASTGGPTSWSWTFPSGTPPSATTQNVTGVVWNTAGTYTVTLTATNVAGSTNTTQVITVNANPTVTTTTSGGTICSGNSTTITANGGTSYTWMPGSLTGTTVTVSPTTTTTYTVTGTNAAGCTNTATRTITVNPSPTVTTTTTNGTICSGNSTTITANGGTSYTWMPGSLTGTTVTVSPTTTTTYTVTGTAANGCTNTATRTITVNPTPTVTTTATNATICSGNSTSITANGATTYSWMPGSLTGTTVTVSPATTTTYTVTGTSTGCSGTTTQLITVNTTPTVTTTTSGGTICSGNSTTLTANGGATYTWMPGSLTGTTVTVSPTTTTTYTVTGTAANGCTNTATRTITVNPSPTVTATASSTSICTGNNVTLTGNGANTYNWMPGNLNGASVTITPASTTTYTLTGTAANGCTGTETLTITVGPVPTVTASSSSPSVCIGNSATLTANGATTYTWMPGSLTGTSVTVSPTVTTTYTVTGVNGPGCQNTATITLTVDPLPNVTASTSSATICSGNSVTLTGNGASTYNWMPGNFSGASVTDAPAVTTNYTVTGTSAAGCVNTATVNVTVNPTPTVSCSSSNNAICIGSSVTLTANGSTNYNWMPGNLSGASVTDAPTITTTYTVTGTELSGCSSTATVLVTVYAQPSITATGNNVVCPGNSTTLYGGGGVSYVWQPGNLTTDSITVTPSSTTSYTVTGTDASGCTNTAIVTVTVDTPPAVPTINIAGNVLTSSVSGASYQWYLNGLPISGATNQSDTATQSGSYTVEVFDAAGCSSGQSTPVVITGIDGATHSADYLNVFPNPNDGHFQLSFHVNKTDNYVLEIYNALGQVVYNETLNSFSGVYTKDVNIGMYGKGTYTIRLRSKERETVIMTVVY